MSGTIEIAGLDERIKKLGEASTKNPEMRRRINEVIRQMLSRVRKSLQGQARSGLAMKSDPRKAYKAVRMAVYRKIFGGQVNILPSRRAGVMRFYAPPSKRKSNIGGNRRKRSDRTTDIMSYTGQSRGFVLRFLNAGTQVRYNGGRNGRTEEEQQIFALNHGGVGHRGRIAPRNWFGGASQKELENAARNIDKMIDDIVAGVLY